MLRSAAAVLAILSAGLGPAAPAAADGFDYLALLDEQGVSYPSEESALGVGQGICRVLGNGGALPRVINALHQRGWDSPREQSIIIASAGRALCPEIGPVVQSQLETLSQFS